MTPAPTPIALVVREYQTRAVQAFGAYTDTTKGCMWVMATGTGKTLTGHLIVSEYAKQGKRVIWLAHRDELVRQPYKTLLRWWPELAVEAGIVKASQNQCHKRIIYATRDTLFVDARRDQVLRYGFPDLLVVDEAHVSASPSYKKVIAALTGPNTRVLGLTATPDREDGERLSEQYEVVFNYSILDALEDGALIQPYAAIDEVPELDMSKAGGRKDYTAADSERELMRVEIVKHTVASIQKVHLAHRLPFKDGSAYFDLSQKKGGILVFTATINQAELTAEALRAAGWRAEAICGDTKKVSKKKRAWLLEEFEHGRIDILCNAAVLTTGTDLPVCHCIVLARPTKSWSLFVQMVGRALRPYGDQTMALVLDLVGCTKFHSIVAAPVLVDGGDCPKSADQRHRYLAIEGTGEGRCFDCGKIVKCFARKSGHLFVEGRCKACGATQCEPHFLKKGILTHEWIAWEDHKRKCLHCEAEVPDPTGKIKSYPPEREPVDWKTLSLPGRVRTAHLGGRMGILFEVKHGDEIHVPFWHDGDKLHSLASRPVSSEISAALLDDVARRASKVNGRYGAKASKQGYALAYGEAERLAIRLRLWERV